MMTTEGWSTTWSAGAEQAALVDDAIKLAGEPDGRLTLAISHHACTINECLICSIIICPHREPLHLHHDGCPACTADDFEGFGVRSAIAESRRRAIEDKVVQEQAEKILSNARTVQASDAWWLPSQHDDDQWLEDLRRWERRHDRFRFWGGLLLIVCVVLAAATLVVLGVKPP